MDPYDFAIAVLMAVAALFGGDAGDVPTSPDVPTQEVVDDSTYTVTTGEHAGTTVIVNPFDLEWDEKADVDGEQLSIGWVVSSSSGELVCVTAAPCEQDPTFCGPECSSFNWITREEN